MHAHSQSVLPLVQQFRRNQHAWKSSLTIAAAADILAVAKLRRNHVDLSGLVTVDINDSSIIGADMSFYDLKVLGMLDFQRTTKPGDWVFFFF